MSTGLTNTATLHCTMLHSGTTLEYVRCVLVCVGEKRAGQWRNATCYRDEGFVSKNR